MTPSPGDPPEGRRVAGIIGWPVAHSLSPAIQNAAFKAAGLDWTYVAFGVAPENLERAISGIRALGIAGVNVTMPHKSAVIPYLDEVSPDAAQAGAVNTITTTAGRLFGTNTDGPGFVRFLERDAAFSPAGRRVLLLGAGGAARGLAVALATSGATVTVAARRSEPAAAVAALADGDSVPWEERGPAASKADLIVNATPLGAVDPAASPLEQSAVGAGQIVVDLVYSPPETPLLRAARAGGAQAHNGLGMLLHQAALAFELWTAVPAPLEAMSAAAIVAIGHEPGKL